LELVEKGAVIALPGVTRLGKAQVDLMAIFLKILIGVITCLTLNSCGSKSEPQKTVDSAINPIDQSKNPASDSNEDTCRFAGETDATSLEQHLENIKQALSGPELSKYFISCGSFIGGERYYQDLITPASAKILKEIRDIKKFKALAYRTMVTSNVHDLSYLDVIAANGNWKNDRQTGSYLVRLLYSKDGNIRLSAAGALKGATSPAIVAKLVQMTKSPNVRVRFISATALEFTKVPAGRNALFELRNDPDPGVRAQATLGSL
jgi:hypothetical protein